MLCDCCRTVQQTCQKNRDANGQSLCDSCLRALRDGYRPTKWTFGARDKEIKVG